MILLGELQGSSLSHNPPPGSIPVERFPDIEPKSVGNQVSGVAHPEKVDIRVALRHKTSIGKTESRPFKKTNNLSEY
jgi:hypothetical protein